MISIIVPAYNCESTLNRCVESVLSQQFKDFELLLVDDGSTDGTPALCDAYAAKDSRVRAFHKPNGGVSSARNMGLDNAEGEWITFVDSDDVLAENALQLIADVVSQQDSEIPDLIVENLMIIHHNEPAFALYGPGLYTVNQLYGQGLWGAVWNKTFSRSIIEEYRIRFDESLRFSEDCLFVAEYCGHLNSNRLAYIVEPCYIQYEPESYGRKYDKFRSFEFDLDLYIKTKRVNRECSTTMVDGLVMSLCDEIRNGENEAENIKRFKDVVGEDIVHALGKKKTVVRGLSRIDSLFVWKAVLLISAKLHLV